MSVCTNKSKRTKYWKTKNDAIFISFLLQINYLQYCGLWNDYKAVEIN